MSTLISLYSVYEYKHAIAVVIEWSVRVDHILHKAALRHEASAAGDGVMPWTDIITACVHYQLAWLQYHKVSAALVLCSEMDICTMSLMHHL